MKREQKRNLLAIKVLQNKIQSIWAEKAKSVDDIQTICTQEAYKTKHSSVNAFMTDCIHASLKKMQYLI